MKILNLLLLCFFYLLGGCEKPSGSQTSSASYKVENNTITFQNDSAFLKHLVVALIDRNDREAQLLREVGQIIALSNFDSASDSFSWNWLDIKNQERAKKNINISLLKNGVSLGMARVSRDFTDFIKVGDEINVFRYGISKKPVLGKVIFSSPSALADLQLIYFIIDSGREWIPGTHCELEFKLKIKPIHIPMTALLHIKSEEYVLKQMAQGVFSPVHVTVLADAGEKVLVSGSLTSEDKIVSRGAILLKNDVKQLVGGSND